jgi:hypothetical protein
MQFVIPQPDELTRIHPSLFFTGNIENIFQFTKSCLFHQSFSYFLEKHFEWLSTPASKLRFIQGDFGGTPTSIQLDIARYLVPKIPIALLAWRFVCARTSSDPTPAPLNRQQSVSID